MADDEKRKVATEVAVTLDKSTLEQTAGEIRSEVDRIKNTLKEVEAQGKYSFKELGNALKLLNRETKEFEPSSITTAVSELTAGAEGATDFGVSLSGMSDIAQFVFGSVLGISAVSVLREIIGYFSEAKDNATDLSHTLFNLDVGIRQLRRGGLDVTFEGAIGLADELSSRFKHLSDVDMAAIIAQAYNMTATMQLTEDQIQALIESAIAMSEINGKEIPTNIQAVISAMNGYSVSLRNAGVTIDDTMVKQRAYEMGLADSGDELTLQARQIATLSLTYDALSGAISDVEKYSDTYAGRLDALDAKNKALSVSIGTLVLPMWIKIKEAVYDASVAYLRLIAIASILPMILENAFGLDGLAQLNYDFIQWVNNIETGLDDVKSSFEDSVDLGTGLFSMEDAGSTEEYQNLIDKLEDLAIQEARKRRDAKEKLLQNLEDLEEDYADKLIDINTKLQQKLEDIDREYVNKREDEHRKYLYRIEDAEKDFDERVEKAKQDAREKEENRERELQEKLLRLREQFMMSLEDALRDRNVRQALRLRQEYDLNKKQILRQNELDKEINAKKLQQELKDIEEARRRKLEKLRIDYARRLEELALFQSREIESARRGYDQDLEELNKWLEQKRQDYLDAYDQDLKDIKKWSNDKIQDLAKAYADQNTITLEGLAALYENMTAYLGPGGYIDSLYDYLLQSTGFTMSQVAEMMNFGINNTGTGNNGKGGGTIEHTPVPTTDPIDLPVNPFPRELLPRKQFGNVNAITTTINRENAVVELRLSEGLMADIIDSSLTNLAIQLERSE